MRESTALVAVAAAATLLWGLPGVVSAEASITRSQKKSKIRKNLVRKPRKLKRKKSKDHSEEVNSDEVSEMKITSVPSSMPSDPPSKLVGNVGMASVESHRCIDSNAIVTQNDCDSKPDCNWDHSICAAPQECVRTEQCDPIPDFFLLQTNQPTTVPTKAPSDASGEGRSENEYADDPSNFLYEGENPFGPVPLPCEYLEEGCRRFLLSKQASGNDSIQLVVSSLQTGDATSSKKDDDADFISAATPDDRQDGSRRLRGER